MYELFVKALLLSLSAHRIRFIRPPNSSASREEQATYVRNTAVRGGVKFWSFPSLFPNCFCVIACFEAAIIAMSIFEPSIVVPKLFSPSARLDVRNLQPSIAVYLGFVSLYIGTSIRAACYRRMGRFFRFELSIQQGHKLITDGPYAVVRHPAYVGAFFIYLGACLCQLGPHSLLMESGLWVALLGRLVAGLYLMYCLSVLRFLIARAPKEDIVMKEEFGTEWEVWAKRTPYRLVPYVY